MRLIFANACYDPHRGTGGTAHIYQFIRCAATLGHEVWTYPPDAHPDAQRLPVNRLERLKLIRSADALYVRLESLVPKAAHWSVPPRRWLIGALPVVWEFNTVPETGLIYGASQEKVNQTVRRFRHFSRGVDLACCVSIPLGDYVRDVIGIQRIVIVPNGSDPDMFRPDVEPVSRIQRFPDRLNVVWIGSADIPWHNLALLREAALILWQRYKEHEIVFHLLGQANPGLMREMPPNVHYHGTDVYEAMPHWLAAADVGLVLYHPGPAHYGSPTKLFDYMASGLAVVGTPAPQVRQVLHEMGHPDLLVDHDDAAGLVRVLLMLHKDRDLLKRCGAAGRRLVVEYYNWRRAVAETMDAIEAVRAERKKHPLCKGASVGGTTGVQTAIDEAEPAQERLA